MLHVQHIMCKGLDGSVMQAYNVPVRALIHHVCDSASPAWIAEMARMETEEEHEMEMAEVYHAMSHPYDRTDNCQCARCVLAHGE